jgi:hypothetical protein
MLEEGQSVYRQRRCAGLWPCGQETRQPERPLDGDADLSAATEGFSGAPSAELETDRHLDATGSALPGTLFASELFWARRFSGLLPVACDDHRPRLVGVRAVTRIESAQLRRPLGQPLGVRFLLLPC